MEESMRSILLNRIEIGILCLFLLAFWGCSSSEHEGKTAAEESEAPAFVKYASGENEALGVNGNESEYVGSIKCKECHWREYDSWKHTLHSKFMQFPPQATVMGDFVGTTNSLTVRVTKKVPKETSKDIDPSLHEVGGKLEIMVTSKAPRTPLGNKITTTMSKKGQKYYVNTIGPDWEFHDYEVTAVIGVNRRQNYLTTFPNGQQHVLPIEWDVGKQQWVDYYGMKHHFPATAIIGVTAADSGNTNAAAVMQRV